MNINASNPSLINILLQQATKSQEKKRPTFEQVFAKLNVRTAGMNANKQPMNNMLTNEQLFRYYIKETDPLLRISDDKYDVDDALNPMKESDPNKVYGSATTQTSDVIPSRNPYNNQMNRGFQDPLQAQIEAQARAAGIAGRTGPISGRLAALAQQYNTPFAMPPMTPQPPQPRIPSAAPASPAIPEPTIPTSILPLGGDAVIIDYNMAKDELAVAENVINRLSSIDWGAIPPETQTIFSILFNNNDFYSVETTEYMKGLIRAGTIERALEGINDVFKQTRGNMAVNSFITERIGVMMGIDTTSGIAAVEKFDKLFNPNKIGIGEGRISMERFTVNVLNYLNSQRTLNSAEKTRVDRDILNIEDAGLAGNATKYIGEITSRFQALELQYMSVIPTPSAIMGDLFYDGISELTTNTDINSVELDPQIVRNLAGRNASASKRSGAGLEPLNVLPASAYSALSSLATVTGSASSVIAEAGSAAGVDIDNAIMKRGRGVQAGDIRGPYEKTRKKTAATTLQAAVRRALEQQGDMKSGTTV